MHPSLSAVYNVTGFMMQSIVGFVNSNVAAAEVHAYGSALRIMCLRNHECGLTIIKHDHQPLLVHDCTIAIEDASIIKCDPECGSTIIKHDPHRCRDHGWPNDDN